MLNQTAVQLPASEPASVSDQTEYAYSIVLTTPEGHSFVLCGNRSPEEAGTDLLLSAMGAGRYRGVP